ncbi:MAG: hypothetical protein Q7R66_20350 [Undibacterium sp.]|nr:hypothetical protein [Undibacterium sp.]MDO8654529.1 hypothetical protein [Undibacterium sp.]
MGGNGMLVTPGLSAHRTPGPGQLADWPTAVALQDGKVSPAAVA